MATITNKDQVLQKLDEAMGYLADSEYCISQIIEWHPRLKDAKKKIDEINETLEEIPEQELYREEL